MWCLRQKLVKAGLNPLQTKTDAVYLEGQDVNVERLGLKLKDYYDDQDVIKKLGLPEDSNLQEIEFYFAVTDFENIGRYKHDYKYNERASLKPAYKPINQYEPAALVAECKEYVVNKHFVDGERDGDSVCKALDQFQRILIKARAPGCGKSTAVFNYAKRVDAKALLLCAWNETVRQADWPEEHKMTAASFFNLNMRGNASASTISPDTKLGGGGYDTHAAYW